MELSWAEYYLYLICKDIMSVTYAEYVEIIASMFYLYEQELRCNDTEYPSTKIRDQKRFMKSCNVKSENIKYKYANTEFYTCPCTFHNPQITFLLEYYHNYEKHGLSALANIYKTSKDGYIPSKFFEMIKIIEGFVQYKKQEAEAIQRLRNLQEQAKKGIR